MKDISQDTKVSENSNSSVDEYACPEQAILSFLLTKNISILSDMYVKVKIIAGAKRELIEKVSDDHYDISVKQKAENNRANTRLLEIMHLEYPNSIIRIISGHHSPSKILSIESRLEN